MRGMVKKTNKHSSKIILVVDLEEMKLFNIEKRQITVYRFVLDSFKTFYYGLSTACSRIVV